MGRHSVCDPAPSVGLSEVRYLTEYAVGSGGLWCLCQAGVQILGLNPPGGAGE